MGYGSWCFFKAVQPRGERDVMWDQAIEYSKFFLSREL